MGNDAEKVEALLFRFWLARKAFRIYAEENFSCRRVGLTRFNEETGRSKRGAVPIVRSAGCGSKQSVPLLISPQYKMREENPFFDRGRSSGEELCVVGYPFVKEDTLLYHSIRSHHCILENPLSGGICFQSGCEVSVSFLPQEADLFLEFAEIMNELVWMGKSLMDDAYQNRSSVHERMGILIGSLVISGSFSPYLGGYLVANITRTLMSRFTNVARETVGRMMVTKNNPRDGEEEYPLFIHQIFGCYEEGGDGKNLNLGRHKIFINRKGIFDLLSRDQRLCYLWERAEIFERVITLKGNL